VIRVLATATFSSETASGWQQANFLAPVAIAVIFYTPSIVQTLATGIANALGVH
jgi:hypothetical protein